MIALRSSTGTPRRWAEVAAGRISTADHSVLPAVTELWYDRGLKSFDIAFFGSVRIGVQICTEMWFFEWARHYAASRPDLLCIPRATPHSSIDKWLAGGQTTAVCSGAYSISSNLWYPPGHKISCGGLGWIIDPEGNVIKTTNQDSPFATVEIDLEFSRLSKFCNNRL
jgi:N-carbamoylputrescine amidase